MPNKSSREETNSITHLVKIVAKEVVHERFTNIHKAVIEMMVAEALHKHCQQNEHGSTSNYLDSIKSSLENVGGSWDTNEIHMLTNELETAIRTIAKNHNRTPNAISMRIRQKDLVPRY